MKQDLGVYGVYTDEPIGMDHPFFMARSDARMCASMAVAQGVPLETALDDIRERIASLFGDVPRALVDATVTTTYLAATADREGPGD